MKRVIAILIFMGAMLFGHQSIAQCIQGDCTNGKGTYKYSDGSIYSGAFKAGEAHGTGICTYPNGDKYEGQWINNKPHGQGSKIYKDGLVKTGLWHEGMYAEGKAMPIKDNNDMIAKGNEEKVEKVGCIKGNCKNGEGTFVYADGSIYKGSFKEGKVVGNGICTYVNGDKYIGTWNDNLFEGKGTLFFSDGSILEGRWEKGEYVDTPKGIKVETANLRDCSKGDCQEGKGFYKYNNGSTYVGEFKEGIPHGQGTCYYANGDKYTGGWGEHKFNGYGIMNFQDGRTIEGIWEGGTYMGALETQAKNGTEEPTKGTEAIEKINDLVKEQKEVKVWAVIVGVSSYSHMPVLKYTDDDAYRIYAFLKSPEGGALPDEQIRVLIDESATKKKITNAMEDVFLKADDNDVVLMYFSGHGLEGSFLPIDYDGYRNKLKHKEIKRLLDKSKAKHKICIADACHSGSMFASRGLKSASKTIQNYYSAFQDSEGGTALLMSSKAEETSLESKGLRQGVFSHFLIRGLKGDADVDKNSIVTVNELHSFIHENVRAYTGMMQTPTITGNYDENMPVGVVRTRD